MQGQADALSALGLVTEDNLATVVQGAKKRFLTSLQSGIDRRVTDAVNKAKEKEAAGGGRAEQTATRKRGAGVVQKVQG